MICRNCEEYQIILDFEKSLVSSQVNVSLNFFDNYEGIENTSKPLLCENCGSHIPPEEYYFDEDFIDFVEDSLFSVLAEEVSQSIDSCEYCGHGLEMQALRHSIDSFLMNQVMILIKCMKIFIGQQKSMI